FKRHADCRGTRPARDRHATAVYHKKSYDLSKGAAMSSPHELSTAPFINLLLYRYLSKGALPTVATV
ncbi:MAG: hypothetical protein II395_04220, partial [Ruminococcus sp.]|nr:hypothetical protein [Ruminococcus sp.]